MRLALALLLTCFSAAHAWPKAAERCFRGSGSVTKRISGFVVAIRPHGIPDDGDAGCRVTVRDSTKKVIFSASDDGFSIAPVEHAAEDSHTSYLILEGDSGGAHCCWTYYILSLKEPAGLVRKFENQRGAAFSIDAKTGMLKIRTMDGAFDYFAGLSHAATPFPDVYLRLEGKDFIDESSEHISEYDRTIALAKKELRPSDLQRFRTVADHDPLEGDTMEIASKVLKIVFAYLYSGRRAQAHQALVQMWPDFERQKLWDLIICTRRNGILKYVHRKAPSGPPGLA